MALFRYLKKIPTGAAEVPDPNGPLSSTFPPETIVSANKEVKSIQQGRIQSREGSTRKRVQ